jgi:hypothetical protein
VAQSSEDQSRGSAGVERERRRGAEEAKGKGSTRLCAFYRRTMQWTTVSTAVEPQEETVATDMVWASDARSGRRWFGHCG